MELLDFDYLNKKNEYDTIIKEIIVDALLSDNMLANLFNREYLLEQGKIDFHYLSESGKSYAGLKIKTPKGYQALRVPKEEAIKISNIIELEFPSKFKYLLKSQGKSWLVEEVRK